MEPPPSHTPDGIYWLVLNATGNEDLARDARLEALMNWKMNQVMAGG